MEVHPLSLLLRAAAYLVGSTKLEAAQDLKAVLISRLTQFYSELGRPGIDIPHESLEELQMQTAKEALFVVDKIQQVLHASLEERNDQIEASGGEALTVGARDLSHIRTLLSVAFKWGIDPLLNRVVLNWPSKPFSRQQGQSTIIDLTRSPEDFNDLCTLTRQLLSLILPAGYQGPLSQTFIANSLLSRHDTDLLKPCITLGWLPKALSFESTPTQDGLRPFVMRLLSMPSSQAILALGGVISSSPPLPPHVKKSCSFLLGRQLIRPTGVYGLCAAIFGEQETSEDEVSLEKLQHISNVLSTIPQSMQAHQYFTAIIPQLLTLLSTEGGRSTPAYERAAAYSLSRMLTDESAYRSVVSSTLLPLAHDQISRETQVPALDSDTKDQQAQDKVTGPLSPLTSVNLLQTLLINTDPSPTLISALFTPVAPSLYALYAYLDGNKTTDPAFKETVKGLLETWARVVGAQEVIEACWSIICGNGGYWKVDVAGGVRRTDSPERMKPLSLFTPDDLNRAEEGGELDVDSNLLDLRPDPAHFVGFLKSINRPDVAADLFVRLLEQYRELKLEPDADPFRTLLYLQLVVQIQEKMADTASSSNIFKKPEHILSFVKHSLEFEAKITTRKTPSKPSGLRLEDLRIVSDDEDTLDAEDSDDESPDPEDPTPNDEEFQVTAINLLLALLEANPSLSPHNSPTLDDIFPLLEPLTKHPSESVRPLAREARMVMTARLASTTSQSVAISPQNDEESSLQVYQKALTLLQDPLLPVRAHGLMLLRQLVSPDSSSGQPTLEPALVPGVLSIFLQSIQDDDSYMFLNAVQGLAAMVDGFGKEVLKGLVNDYASGLDGSAGIVLTQTDVDLRVRIGEALGQVIRRCGEALPLYIDILAPPLARVVRSSYIPTTIRTSALSLLAQIASTRVIALLPYAADLFDGMIDLLQLESVPATSRRAQQDSLEKDKGEEQQEDRAATMDSRPTVANSKFPPLRRAALHFLSLLLRAFITRVYDMGTDGLIIPVSSTNRAKTILSYTASVDEDGVVKVMAREAKELLEQLSRAVIGI